MEEEKVNKILIANLKIEKANTEYPWALPKGTKWFTLQVRDGTAVRVAVESGHVANSEPPYFTLKANSAWDERYFNINSKYGFPLYFACASAEKFVEMLIGIYDSTLGGI